MIAESTVMSTLLKCQLEKDGKCSSCSNVVPDDSIIGCTKCKLLFHAVCPTYENEICNKTLFKMFSAKSTKCNFMWFCDPCLTSFEFEVTANDTARINNLEHQIKTMNSRFDEMKELILNTMSKDNQNAGKSNTQNKLKSNNDSVKQSVEIEETTEDILNVNPWQVQSRVTILKDNLGNIPDLSEFERKAMDKNLNVKKATHDKKGNIILVCPSAQDALAVHEQATKDFPLNTVLDPKSPTSVINIVGFRTNHSVDILYELLIKANASLSSLQCKPLTEVKMCFDIVAVKPCAKNPSVFRAVVRVSKALRHQIKLSKDKLKIGFYVCSVYDQILAKRCNKCQTFGHWSNECTANTNVVCARCGKNHDTQNCESTTYNCVNCAKTSGVDCDHSANSTNCPAYIAYRDSLQHKANKTPIHTGQNGPGPFLHQI